ncbi:hypothetical protein PRBEI_2000603400 [Prionailurus iriomotensis]
MSLEDLSFAESRVGKPASEARTVLRMAESPLGPGDCEKDFITRRFWGTLPTHLFS